ncbi:MAG: hypothetical protein U0165_14635 [Polyangiaceae bacterium]
MKCLKLPMGLTAARRDAFLSAFMTEARVLRRLAPCDLGGRRSSRHGRNSRTIRLWTPTS